MKYFLSITLCFFSIAANAYTLKEYTQDLDSLKPDEKKKFFLSANQLKCPTCIGLSVLGSDTPFSMQIRKKVVSLVKENKDEETIKNFFTNRYGLWILRAPPKEGFHLLVWVIPGLIILATSSRALAAIDPATLVFSKDSFISTLIKS